MTTLTGDPLSARSLKQDPSSKDVGNLAGQRDEKCISQSPREPLTQTNGEMSSLFFLFFVFLGTHPWHMEVPRGFQDRGGIRAAAAGLHHSHSNARSEPSLQPTPQLMAMLDR